MTKLWDKITSTKRIAFATYFLLWILVYIPASSLIVKFVGVPDDMVLEGLKWCAGVAGAIITGQSVSDSIMAGKKTKIES